MGLVRATAGALGGTLADQWKDFLTVPGDLAPTSALFPAVPVGANARRGSNTSASTAVVTNGSRIVVPEGYGLLLLQEGALTGFVSEPGGYTWDVDSPYSQSVFAGDDWSTSLIKQSWERFKFGGRPGAQQLALFVCLKELPNNRFGTQSTIYWDDRYLNAQVGAIAHGTYSVNILDPILFAIDFVPATYLQGQDVFDFTDRANPAANQLFLEVVGSLAAAFSLYANDEERSNRIANLQKDSLGFAASLAQVVEDSYQWLTTRGLAMSKATIVGIEYDDPTRELLKTVQRADALSGSRGNANLQASVAAGLEAAGEQGGSSAILGVGIAGGSIGLASLMQDEAASGATKSASGPSDLLTVLENLQRAHEAGLISKEEFEAAKAKALGLS
jgi:membrane protease subunit (stomatin/prohibitin family)